MNVIVKDQSDSSISYYPLRWDTLIVSATRCQPLVSERDKTRVEVMRKTLDDVL